MTLKIPKFAKKWINKKIDDNESKLNFISNNQIKEYSYIKYTDKTDKNV